MSATITPDAQGAPADVRWSTSKGLVYMRVAEKNTAGRIHRHAGITLTRDDLAAMLAAVESEAAR